MASSPTEELGLADPTLSSDAILARAKGENFPVVFRGLPRLLREDLLALYGYARLVDEVGDTVRGDRLALLDELSADVRRIRTLRCQNPLIQRLAITVRRHELPLEPLERLIEANRRDQALSNIESWHDLVESCTRSANPIGELVLGILDSADTESVAGSDAVCTALQVVEHCQDVREDAAIGRVYLPADDLVRFGCGAGDLCRTSTSPALRAVVKLQVERARNLLGEADRLLAGLRGLAVPLIAAYAAGGLATCDALLRHDCDVMSIEIRRRRRDFIRRFAALMWRAMRSRFAT